MKPTVKITDHAVLQYLERVLLMDIEGLRTRIETAVQKSMIEELGPPSKVTINGVVFPMRGYTVTTCWTVKPQTLAKLRAAE